MSTTLSIGRRFLSFVLCLALASILSLSAYASAADNANHIVSSCQSDDTSHPYAFFTAKSKNSKLINQYTTGNPAPNTPLTTWSWTGDPSQWFERVIFTANGSTGMAWSTYIDPTLVINCNRVGSAPEVNLQPAINNRRADIEVFYTGRGSGGGLYVLPRYIHPKNMYITIGSALPNGNGNYLHWTTGGSTFYMYDVGLGIFD